jgi:threonylcarbamoyladenosine tRNA methylthiotransferase MtaB
MSPQVVTFGCRLNIFESQVIKSQLECLDDPNVIVFNTCAVTKEAERQARQAIRKAKRKNPECKIIVTGCAAQIDPARYAAMPEVDQVLGNEEKLDVKNYTDSSKVVVSDIMEVKETAAHMVGSFEGRARAFVQVQNGCDHRCTFCIIPYGRGNSRSVPVGHIVEHVRRLVHEEGFNEIVFTGVDISDYGKNLPGQPRLGEMMRRVLNLVPELKRLRLSSIDVAEIDDAVIDLIANEPRFMPHLHISLQAGDDMILKRMKRRHSRSDVIEFCNKARELRPDVAFGADIIAGFPTETNDMFLNTLRLVEEAKLQHLHVFPYSAREGTPAAKMPQVPEPIRKERAAQLRLAGTKQLSHFLDQKVNTVQKVIVEEPSFARSEHFVGIDLSSPMVSLGGIIDVRITGVEGNHWQGEPIHGLV